MRISTEGATGRKRRNKDGRAEVEISRCRVKEGNLGTGALNRGTLDCGDGFSKRGVM